MDRLNDIHNLFRAQLASGKMTDADYAKKARELLNILGDFDGLILPSTAFRSNELRKPGRIGDHVGKDHVAERTKAMG